MRAPGAGRALVRTSPGAEVMGCGARASRAGGGGVGQAAVGEGRGRSAGRRRRRPLPPQRDGADEPGAGLRARRDAGSLWRAEGSRWRGS